MLDAPVEWVAGDRYWNRVFTAFRWALWGIVIALGSVALYSTLVVVGLVQGPLWPPPSVPGWPILLLASLVPLAQLYLIGHTPAAGAIGISPTGLLLPSFRTQGAFPWNRMRWIDPTHLYVETGLGFTRFELTPNQAQRIRHFFGQG